MQWFLAVRRKFRAKAAAFLKPQTERAATGGYRPPEAAPDGTILANLC
jgi:hypothetical protein